MLERAVGQAETCAVLETGQGDGMTTVTDGELREFAELKRSVARVRKLHQQYLPAFVDYYTCAHCNLLHGGLGVEPWPCPTIRALDGAS